MSIFERMPGLRDLIFPLPDLYNNREGIQVRGIMQREVLDLCWQQPPEQFKIIAAPHICIPHAGPLLHVPEVC